jgi:hypothetical protein
MKEFDGDQGLNARDRRLEKPSYVYCLQCCIRTDFICTFVNLNDSKYDASKFRLLGDHSCGVRETIDAVPGDLVHTLIPGAIHQDVEIRQ